MAVHETDAQDARAVQEMLLDSANVADFLDQLTVHIAHRISGDGQRAHCSITLERDNRPDTIAFSTPEAAELDAIQHRYADGPCITAAREQVVVRVGDVRGDARWPAYHAAVAERGVRSILAVPFDLRGEASAALNIYSATLGDFSPAQTALAVHAVQEASGALLVAARTALRQDTETDLRAALASRTPIDLAVGVIMGQNRCTQEEAIAILKTASSHRNVKLRDLAIDLLAGLDKAPTAVHFTT